MILTDHITGQKISGIWRKPDDFEVLGECDCCGAEENQQCCAELQDGTAIEVSSFVHIGRE